MHFDVALSINRLKFVWFLLGKIKIFRLTTSMKNYSFAVKILKYKKVNLIFLFLIFDFGLYSEIAKIWTIT